MKGLKIPNPYGAFTYDVAVLFRGEQTTVEVPANTMTEAAELAKAHGYTVLEEPLQPWDKRDYEVQIKARKDLSVLVTYTVSEIEPTTAKHSALRKAIDEGFDKPEYMGIFAVII